MVKQFGIYTIHRFIYVFVYVGSILRGFVFTLPKNENMSNKTINDYLKNNIENMEDRNIFEFDLEEVEEETRNLSYLGQVNENLEHQLRRKFVRIKPIWS